MGRIKDFLKQSARVILFSLISVGTIGVALAWTGPSTAPPGGITIPPINTSINAQTKSGGLTVGSLTTAGSIAAGSVTTGSGSVTATTYYQGSLPLWAYGGMYNSSGSTNYLNPYTGARSCPAGYIGHIIFSDLTGCCSPYTQNTLVQCTSI